jgi:predicted amidophosphoribosyltransferase
MPTWGARAKALLRSAGDFFWPPRWDRARAALIYDEASRRPVLDLKRAGRRDGLGTLCGWMRQAGGVLIDEADVLVPVPLHAACGAGFQPVRLAGAGGGGGVRAAGGGGCAGAHTRRTPSQAGLEGRARRRNVSGAFKVRKSGLETVAGKRVLLVDEVLTTGATLSACTRPETGRGAAR